MFGSAGRVISIADGLDAMMDAITITNSGKPIGRWPEAAKASARVSDNQTSFCSGHFIGSAALHNLGFGAMAARPAGH